MHTVHHLKMSEYALIHEPVKVPINKNNINYPEKFTRNLPELGESESVGIKWFNRVRYRCNLCECQVFGRGQIYNQNQQE